jgi:hypothetical protein
MWKGLAVLQRGTGEASGMNRQASETHGGGRIPQGFGNIGGLQIGIRCPSLRFGTVSTLHLPFNQKPFIAERLLCFWIRLFLRRDGVVLLPS